MAGLTIGSWWSLVGMSIAATGFYGTKGPFWSMPTMFLTGAAAASGIAWINSLGNLGGFFGPSLVGWAKHFTGSFAGGLYALAAFALISAIVSAFWLTSRAAAPPPHPASVPASSGRERHAPSRPCPRQAPALGTRCRRTPRPRCASARPRPRPLLCCRRWLPRPRASSRSMASTCRSSISAAAPSCIRPWRRATSTSASARRRTGVGGQGPPELAILQRRRAAALHWHHRPLRFSDQKAEDLKGKKIGVSSPNSMTYSHGARARRAITAGEGRHHHRDPWR